MWKLLFDHHTHTTFSHGKGSIEDNVIVACGKGLESIAITDHGPGHLTYGVKRGDIPVMRRVIEELKPKYPEIEILLGVEANIVSTRDTNYLDLTEEDKSYLDFVIAGYHYGIRHGYTVQNYVWQHGLKAGGKSLLAKNTDMMVASIYENDLYILTHPGDKGPFDIDEVAKACEAKGVLMEINTKHPHLNVEEIRTAAKYDVKFVLSSDAHVPENVGNVEGPLARLAESGLDPERVVNIRWEED